MLIPRPETEFLVEKTIEIINNNFQNPKIIDLGCGTGVIGLTLKKEIENSKVKLIDIDKRAIKCSKKNAKKLKVNVEINRQNMLEKEKEKFDVIISNPPYISKKEKIENVVYKNEPHHALFADKEGLYFYENILSQAEKNVYEKSIIAFEIGDKQAKKIKKIALKYFPKSKIIIKKDLNQKDRYLFILNKKIDFLKAK